MLNGSKRAYTVLIALVLSAGLIFLGLDLVQNHGGLSGPLRQEIVHTGVRPAAVLAAETNYESVDKWHEVDVPAGGFEPSMERPLQQDESYYTYSGEFLQQTIVADYPDPAVEDMHVMVKTNATRFWERMPVHVYTTFTRVPSYTVYSTRRGSLAGMPVVDALELIPPTDKLQRTLQYQGYQIINKIREEHWGWKPSEMRHPVQNGSHVDLNQLMLLPMLLHAYEAQQNAKWYVIMEDDSYLSMGALSRYLEEADSNEKIYYGVDHHTKLVVNETTIDITYAPLAGGIVVSRALLQELFSMKDKSPSDLLQMYTDYIIDTGASGEQVLALALKQELKLPIALGAGTSQVGYRFQTEPINAVEFSQESWCSPILSWGKLAPDDIEILWEYERLHDPETDILYSELYKDFIQPHIQARKSNWNLETKDYVWNGVNDLVATTVNKPHRRLYPNETIEDCEDVCKSMARCFSWTFHPGYCGLRTGTFTLGAASNPWLESWTPEPGLVAGWTVDKIRAFRAKKECDELVFDERVGVYTDRSDESEGWYARKLSAARSPNMIHTSGTLEQKIGPSNTSNSTLNSK